MPVLRPVGLHSRSEPYFPTIRALLEEDHADDRYIDLRPSHVFTIRRLPKYLHQSQNSGETFDDEDIEGEGRLIYGIDSSFLIPDWIFDENNDTVFDPEPEEVVPPHQETTLKNVITKSWIFARKLFSSKALRSRP